MKSFLKGQRDPTIGRRYQPKKKSTFCPPTSSIPVEILTFEQAFFKEVENISKAQKKPFYNGLCVKMMIA